MYVTVFFRFSQSITPSPLYNTQPCAALRKSNFDTAPLLIRKRARYHFYSRNDDPHYLQTHETCRSTSWPFSISDCKNRYRGIGKRLSQADSQEFNIDTFYIYGWSGLLSANERQKAAERLYTELVDHKGPVTIIAHSHGCNVALLLANVAQKLGNKELAIERLVLLAPPVQEATSCYISSSLFKSVISCYSTSDLMQVMDPQRIASSSTRAALSSSKPFFSKRTFPHSANLKQVRVLINMQNPGHRSFLMAPFLKSLPMILSLIEKEDCGSEYIVNVPPGQEKPHLMRQMRLAYVPRQHRSRHSRFFA